MRISPRLSTSPVSLETALTIVARIADALDYAFNAVDEHGQILRLVHRDIKPSNVQVTVEGEVKVLDFGVARADLSERESETGVHVLGSMHYLAPERFEGISGAESDIYSLGVVLFEILVGERMGRCSPDPRRHESFLRTVRERLTEKLGPSGAGVTEVVVQMCAHTSSYDLPPQPFMNAARNYCDFWSLSILRRGPSRPLARSQRREAIRRHSHRIGRNEWGVRSGRGRMNLQMRCSGLPPVISRWNRRMQSVMTHFQWSLIPKMTI